MYCDCCLFLAHTHTLLLLSYTCTRHLLVQMLFMAQHNAFLPVQFIHAFAMSQLLSQLHREKTHLKFERMMSKKFSINHNCFCPMLHLYTNAYPRVVEWIFYTNQSKSKWSLQHCNAIHLNILREYQHSFVKMDKNYIYWRYIDLHTENIRSNWSFLLVFIFTVSVTEAKFEV